MRRCVKVNAKVKQILSDPLLDRQESDYCPDSQEQSVAWLVGLVAPSAVLPAPCNAPG